MPEQFVLKAGEQLQDSTAIRGALRYLLWSKDPDRYAFTSEAVGMQEI